MDFKDLTKKIINKLIQKEYLVPLDDPMIFNDKGECLVIDTLPSALSFSAQRFWPKFFLFPSVIITSYMYWYSYPVVWHFRVSLAASVYLFVNIWLKFSKLAKTICKISILENLTVARIMLTSGETFEAPISSIKIVPPKTKSVLCKILINNNLYAIALSYMRYVRVDLFYGITHENVKSIIKEAQVINHKKGK